jgi:hypothetical protein
VLCWLNDGYDPQQNQNPIIGGGNDSRWSFNAILGRTFCYFSDLLPLESVYEMCTQERVGGWGWQWQRNRKDMEWTDGERIGIEIGNWMVRSASANGMMEGTGTER